MRSAALVIATLLAAGCGQGDKGVRVELAQARLVFAEPDGSTHALTLAADGAVAFDGEAVIKIRKDGQVEADGKLFARLEKDGKVYAHGVATNVVIQPDGTFEMDGAPELSIAEDGTVTGNLLETMDHPMLPVEGAKVRYEGPPGARRATMLGFAAFVTNLPGARKPG